MMDSLTASIKFNSAQNCFISVPRTFQSKISFEKVALFEVICLEADRPVRANLSWSGEWTTNDQFVQVSGLFASQIGFNDGDKVFVQLRTERIPRCRQVFIEPRSQYDWDEFEKYANEIEQNLLNQVRVVWNEMTFPVWLQSNRICLFLTISKINPDESYVLMETNTELVRVKPSSLSKETSLSISSEETLSSPKQGGLLNRLFTYAGYMNDTKSLNAKTTTPPTEYVELNCLERLTQCPKPIFRVVPIKKITVQSSAINTVFISSAYGEFVDDMSDQIYVGRLIKLLSPGELRSGKEAFKTNTSNDEFISKEQALQTLVRIQLFSGLAKDSIGISEGLRRQLGLFTNSRCTLDVLDLKSKSYSNIPAENSNCAQFPLATKLTLRPILFPFANSASNKDEIKNKLMKELSEMVKQQEVLIVTYGTLLRLNEKDVHVDLNFEQQANCQLILLNNKSLMNLDVRVLEPIGKKLKTKWNIELPFSSVNDLERKFRSPFYYSVSNAGDGDNITGFENELIHLASYVNLSFNQCGSACCLPILISGPWGSGKSTLITALVHRICASGRDVYVSRIDCSKLRGKRIDPLRKLLLAEFDECAYRQPSLILLENLDILVPNTQNMEDKQERIHCDRCAILIHQLICEILHSKMFYGSKLAILGTIKDTHSLHNWLIPGNGEHLFQKVIELQPPTARQRAEILAQLISVRSINQNISRNHLQIESTLARKMTDGYLPIDLRLLVDKAMHQSIMSKSPLNVNHFQMVRKDYIPIAMRELNLRPVSKINWNHIGGLKKVKQTLTETLLWPSRYPNLFAQLPIRPQSSVLLYGPPGTGKTMLAEALANESHVRFICVRGPEVLSKYIGASEAAIRTLFEKANQNAPCILFFDEIDSIAPSRGHDNTGVTDRVVNQILTQMDGVEQLKKGVHVLAATSRPDMLDKALLRPGRFDLTLCCSLPDLEERKEILQKFCQQITSAEETGQQTIKIESRVNFDNLAQQCENFSGADLHALIYNALLESLYDQIYSVDARFQQTDSDQMVDNLLNTNDIDSMVDKIQSLVIGPTHFERAFKQTKPSISNKERLRYEKLYEEFSATKKSPEQKPIITPVQKATLA